ncbi:MAG: tetratricopeptide repeat protein [Phycisphaerae bacterium]
MHSKTNMTRDRARKPVRPRDRRPLRGEDEPPAVGSDTVRAILAAGLIVLAGCVAYGNSFSGVFLLDDYGHIVTNETIRRFFPISRLLATHRPLLTLSLAFNYALDHPRIATQPNPWGYHLFNLTVHLLAGLMLFALLRRTLRLPRFEDRWGRLATGVSLAVALLWTVHPLQTQSVTYIIQRSEAMMGLFALLSLYGLNRAATTRQPWPWAILSVLACFFGMASKPAIVALPFVALLYERLCIADSFRQALRKRWPIHLGLLASWSLPFLTGIAQGVLNTTPRETVSVGFGFTGVTPLAYLGAQAGVVLHYLRLVFWPVGLCLDYQWPVPGSTMAVIGPAIPLAGLMVASLIALRRRPGPAFLGISFFLLLAPTSSVIPIKDLAFEHRMYLPLAAVLTAVALAARGGLVALADRLSLSRRARFAVGWGLVLVVTAALIATTRRRNEDYRSELTMWRDIVTQQPHNARAWDSLGIALSRADRPAEAAEAYRKAVACDPESVQAHANLGKVLARLKRFDEAITAYQRAIELGDDRVDLRHSLAVALASSGRTEAAISLYREVVSRQPAHPMARYNLALALAAVNRLDEAAEQLNEHLRHRPRDVTAHYDLATLLARRNKLIPAVAEYEAVLRLNPRHLQAHYALGVALQGLGKLDEAIAAYRAALAINRDFAPARQALRAALARKESESRAKP